MQIQTDVIQHRVSLRKDGHLRAAFEVCAEVESGRETQFSNRDIARKQRTGGTPAPMKFCVRSGTDSGGIAQPHSTGRGGEIEINLLPREIGMSRECDRATAGSCAQALDCDPVLAEPERAINLAEGTR